MKTLATIPLVAGACQVPCLVGQRVRVTGLSAAITPIADGDSVRIQFSQGSTLVCAASSDLMESSAVTIVAGWGLSPTSAMIESIDPVTGLAAYKPQNMVSMGLPHVTWDKAVTIGVFTDGGPAGAGTLLYEVESYERMPLTPGHGAEKLHRRRA